MSPPKSPVPEADTDCVDGHESPPHTHQLSSSSSSVEIVGEDRFMEDGGDADDEDLEWNTELVHERMASLGLRPGERQGGGEGRVIEQGVREWAPAR